MLVLWFQMNLDKLQNLYDAKMIEAQAELKTKLEKLSVDLESRWSDTLKWVHWDSGTNRVIL